MIGIDHESELFFCCPGEPPQQLTWCLDHRPALLADEMRMSHRRKVVGRRTMSEMRVHDNAEALKLLEIAIDRRQVDVGSAGLNSRRQLLGRGMPISLEEGIEQYPA